MKKWFFLIVFTSLSVSQLFSQCNPAFTYQADTNNFVIFTNQTPSNNAFTYQWNFGDGSPIDTNTNPTHQYNNSGGYVVTLSVDSGTVNCGSTLDTIYVNFCNAYYTAQVTNNVVQFQNYSTASSSSFHYWDFGDGNYSSQKNPTHAYQFAGQYAVTLTVYDTLSNCFASYTDSLIASAPPCQAGFRFSVNNDTLFIQNQASNYQSIRYDFGDSASSNIANPIHVYSQSGSYIVCQTVTDTLNNCSDTFCDTVTINIPPACRAGFSYTTNIDTLFIQNQASNYQSIRYDFGDSTSSNVANPVHVYKQSGSYIICQTVNDTINNCSDTFCDTIIMNIPPPCMAGYTYSTNEDSLFILNTATNYQVLTYDFGDGNSSTLENPTHIYSQSGTYQVCQTVEDTVYNCFNTFCDSVSIAIPSPCQAGFTYYFQGDSTFFQSTAANYDSLIYFFGDGDSSTAINPIHQYLNSGEYVVEQRVYNHRNCISIFRDTLQLTISTSCVAKFELALDTSKPSTLYLINTSSNDNSNTYFWDFGDGNTSTQKNPTHQYTENKPYPICLTVSDTIMNCMSIYCDTVGLDSNGNILKSPGFTLKVLDGSSIGVNEINNPLEELLLYPNPTSSSVSVQWPQSINELNFLVFNIQGKNILRGKMQKRNQTSINLSQVKSGIYWIQIESAEHRVIRKIIKH